MNDKNKFIGKRAGMGAITTIAALFNKLGTATIARQLGKEGYTVKKKTKKNPHKD
jgi:hypothetical protein